jgi:hypothetical protein
MSRVELSINILAAVGSFLSGIVMLITITMEPELKGYKKKVRFFDDDKMVTIWYLK